MLMRRRRGIVLQVAVRIESRAQIIAIAEDLQLLDVSRPQLPIESSGGMNICVHAGGAALA